MSDKCLRCFREIGFFHNIFISAYLCKQCGGNKPACENCKSLIETEEVEFWTQSAVALSKQGCKNPPLFCRSCRDNWLLEICEGKHKRKEYGDEVYLNDPNVYLAKELRDRGLSPKDIQTMLTWLEETHDLPPNTSGDLIETGELMQDEDLNFYSKLYGWQYVKEINVGGNIEKTATLIWKWITQHKGLRYIAGNIKTINSYYAYICKFGLDPTKKKKFLSFIVKNVSSHYGTYWIVRVYRTKPNFFLIMKQKREYYPRISSED